MKILFVTAELAPLVKTGGLADVSGALPRALRGVGIDCRIMLPGYPAILAAIEHPRPVLALGAWGAFPPARILMGAVAEVPVYAVDSPDLYARDGTPYQDPDGRDWHDNPARFGQLCRMAALLGQEPSPVGWRAEIIHCNDWQAGLVPAFASFWDRFPARTLMAIHNLAYQGNFDPGWVGALGLPGSSFQMEGVEFYGAFSFLKGGLFYADRIVTVSPTYAQEIQGEGGGYGLDGLLRARSDRLTGILNGIDDEAWNPARDLLISARYDAADLAGKAKNKAGLQGRLGMRVDADLPLFGVISRLAHQKGLDLILDTIAEICALPAQVTILGSGDPWLEGGFQAAAAARPGEIGLFLGFDEALAHQIEAGADFFLMPSRYEPSGLNQMYSQRYGTPPVAHATGGLVDSVVDCTEAGIEDGSATGFLFQPFARDRFLDAVSRAAAIYREPALYRQLQRNGMARDFGWAASARRYRDLYQSMIGQSMIGA